MKYTDKTTGATVTLPECATSFLAVTGNQGKSRSRRARRPRSLRSTRPASAPTVRALLGQRIFSVVASREDDGVVVLTARSDAESATEIQRLWTSCATWGIQDVVPALVGSDGTTRFALPGRVVVQFVGLTTEQVDARLAERGSWVTQSFGDGGLVEAAVPAGSGIEELIEVLNADSTVRLAEPSWYAVDDLERLRVETSGLGSEAESLGGRWNLTAIDVEGAWRRSGGASDVVVCVVDGFPELEHPALTGKLVPEVDEGLIFSDDTAPSSHATNIAGLVVGEDGDYRGVAPGARVAPVVVNLYGQTYARRAEAIAYVTAHVQQGRLGGAAVSRAVLSCSWRTAGDVTSVRTALADAVAAGIPVVCSAGNADSNASHYPSRYATGFGSFSEGVITVAASSHHDIRAPYSNYGSSVSIVAPGGDGLPFDERDVECPEVGGSYTLAAGTSIAVPHVAGAAALVLSVNATLTAAQVKAMLTDTADPTDDANPGYVGQLGSGRLNVRRAVEAALALGRPEQPERQDPPDEPDEGGSPEPEPSPGGGPAVRVEVNRGPSVSVTVG